MARSTLMNKMLKNTEESLLQKTKNNCRNCIYHTIDRARSKSLCKWWFFYQKQASKEIPNTIIDKGCKFWELNDDTFHPLIENIIKKFNGIVID